MPALRPHQPLTSTSFHPRRPSNFTADSFQSSVKSHVHDDHSHVATSKETFQVGQSFGGERSRASYQAPRPAPAPPVPVRDQRRRSHATPPLNHPHHHRPRQDSISIAVPFPISPLALPQSSHGQPHYPQATQEHSKIRRYRDKSGSRSDRKQEHDRGHIVAGPRDGKENIRPRLSVETRTMSAPPTRQSSRSKFVEEPRHPGTMMPDTRRERESARQSFSRGRDPDPRAKMTDAAAYVTQYRERDRNGSSRTRTAPAEQPRSRKGSGLGSLTRKIGAALSFGKSTAGGDREKALPPAPTQGQHRAPHYQTTTSRLRSASQQRESQTVPTRPKVVSFSGHPTSSSKSKSGPPITNNRNNFSVYPGGGPSHRYPSNVSSSAYERERRQSDKKLGYIPVVFPALYGTGKHRAEFM